jgi:hypothetical protein
MFKDITCIGGHALPEQQTCLRQRFKSRLERFLILVGHRGQHGMGELSPNHRSDLSYFFRWTKPVEPRHQRGVQAGGDG